MKHNVIDHEAILASAGSGKTQKLAYRFIKLMIHGSTPDGICAMTFTRKAAGEILERIIMLLAAASRDKIKSRQLSQDLNVQGYEKDDFMQLLRTVLEHLPRLMIGTLDSFCVNVARSFAGELGIMPDFDLATGQDFAAKQIRKKVMNSVFSNIQPDNMLFQQVSQAIELATNNAAERQKFQAIEQLVKDHHPAHKNLQDSVLWGDPGSIWGTGMPYSTLSASAAHDAVDRLMSSLQAQTTHTSLLKNFKALITGWAFYNTDSEWKKTWSNRGSLAETLLQNYRYLGTQALNFTYYKKELEFTTQESGLLAEIIGNLLHHEITRKLDKTRGLFDYIDQFHNEYTAAIEKEGVLTFDDVVQVLGGNQRIGRSPGDVNRLYIDYRLDRRLDHLLLDEFQDTSDNQWQVIENLADEIIQDNSGKRSFFMVGDIKQAIYGWRGGNPELMGKILNHYSNIDQVPLSICRRSQKPVIDMVNTIFSDLGTLPDSYDDARSEWKQKWIDHTVTVSQNEPSFAAVIQAEDEELVSDDDPNWCRATLDTLEEIDPVSRGLSVGVLVRKNDHAETLFQYLREHNPALPLVLEKTAGLRSNPVIEILVSLARFAAHPGDVLSWRHLQMSPLKRVFESEAINQQELSIVLLEQLENRGFAGLCREWGRHLARVSQISPYEVRLLDDLVELALLFDKTGNRSADDFIEYLETLPAPEEGGSEGNIQVMTVHKAKGLGFDVVIVPRLSGFLEVGTDHGMSTCRDPRTREIKWILDMPRRVIREADPVLSEAAEQMANEKMFEEFCVLYVAMTRAKKALYLVDDASKGNAFDLFENNLSRQTVTGQAATGQAGSSPQEIHLGRSDYRVSGCFGDPDWQQKMPCVVVGSSTSDSADADDQFRTDLLDIVNGAGLPVRQLQPSSTGLRSRRYIDFTSTGNAAVLGSMVHELFAMVDWAETCDQEHIIETCRNRFKLWDKLKDWAVKHFEDAMALPVIREALAKPEGHVTLWREQSFETVIDDQWIAGQFDRVVICHDDNGRMVSAVIQDFKTSRDTSKSVCAEYAEQMDLYARSVSKMTGIDMTKIRKQLIFTRVQDVLEV